MFSRHVCRQARSRSDRTIDRIDLKENYFPDLTANNYFNSFMLKES